MRAGGGASAEGARSRGTHPAESRTADPRGAEFRGTEGHGADFRGAEGRSADFRGAEGRGADFRGAEGRGADFRGAEGHGAEARMERARSGGARSASRADWRMEAMAQPRSPADVESGGGGAYRWAADGGRRAVGGGLRGRLDALRELIALSRTRLDGRTLEGAGRVLETADERYRLSGEHTVVAIAGATGSGKSSLFNALAGANRSQVGPRRPTTAEPVACVWPGSRPGADGLLHRLGVPTHRRHVPADGSSELRGLILIDLPDHDSSATEHRAQVDRMLELVDAVIWVVDPEKYADAVLHERYLRPLAGYAEVMFVVLNQVDRLPGDAADQVVDDLRRLLDEDGLALGEHGEPGAAVLALSAATGRGVGELREALGQFVAERGAADRRLAADVDAATERLRSVYVAQSRVGLTERSRAEFDDRLAEAVGAVATGRAAERDWLRYAERACGSPWSRMRMRMRGPRRRGSRGALGCGVGATDVGMTGAGLTGVGTAGAGTTGVGASRGGRTGAGAADVGRTDVGWGGAARGRRTGLTGVGRSQVGRGAAGQARAGLSRTGWNGDGAEELTAGGRTGMQQGPVGRQSAAGHRRADGAAAAGPGDASVVDGRAAARPVVEHAVRTVAAEAAHGLPAPWAHAVRDAADRGAYGLPEALDKVAAEAEESLRGGPAVKPRWWTVAASLQGMLSVLQVVGVLWLLGAVTGVGEATAWISGLLPAVLGSVGGPALAWMCRVVARGPARRYGQDAERRLRSAAAACGRARVLEPVAAELLRYREVREQYAVASGV
ncbi:GTPase [Streptomyces nigrescens]|uniref:GTPase n=1 Tax=Streptomyces nigrescens TaxID=1920 RepID=UPI003D80A60B